jgi:chemotaxis methyl-accepting protein methylase
MRPSAERRRAHAELLELLERRHGVGTRGAGISSWMELRLDRALDALASDVGGDLERALELLRRDGARLTEVADLLRVGETRFFRDPPQWEALRRAISGFASRERLRALSVGCSTGEEAWSLAMLLDSEKRGYRVVGMDRSETAIASARDGVYPALAREQVPDELAAKYLVPAGDGVAVAEVLRPSVSFVARDAMVGPPPGHYELVVCKNLLIYFGHDAAEKVVELLVRSLADGGLLLVAKSEVPRVKALGYAAEELAPGVAVFRARLPA